MFRTGSDVNVLADRWHGQCNHHELRVAVAATLEGQPQPAMSERALESRIFRRGRLCSLGLAHQQPVLIDAHTGHHNSRFND